MSANEHFFPTEQLGEILLVIEQRRRISINEICIQFAISDATARRFTETPCSPGKIDACPGVQLPCRCRPRSSPTCSAKSSNLPRKRHIGRGAAELVPDGFSSFLICGKMIFDVVRHLHNHKLLSVSQILHDHLPPHRHQLDSLVCLAGMLCASERSLTGCFTEQAIAET